MIFKADNFEFESAVQEIVSRKEKALNHMQEKARRTILEIQEGVRGRALEAQEGTSELIRMVYRAREATESGEYRVKYNVQDGIIGTDEVTLSTSYANTGNLFRYDPENNQYIYNLSTNSFSVGAWQFKIVLNDNKYYTVIISLR